MNNPDTSSFYSTRWFVASVPWVRIFLGGLFLLSCQSCALKHHAKEIASWYQPAEPEPIVGPIYFVGTKGIGAFLIVARPKSYAGKEELVLLDGGVPLSARMLEKSIKRARPHDPFKLEDIKLFLVSHAHFDHVGTLAYMRKKAPNARVVVLKEDAELLKRGGRGDHFFPPVFPFTYPRVRGPIEELNDRQPVVQGELTFIPYRTPGHTKGNATWVTEVKDAEWREKYRVVFVGSTTVLPGVRLVDDESRMILRKAAYEGIADDFLYSFNMLAELEPDIYLAGHTEFFDFERKRNEARDPNRRSKRGENPYLDMGDYLKRIHDEREIFLNKLCEQKKKAEQRGG